MSTYVQKIDLLQRELELQDEQTKEQLEEWQDLPKQQLHDEPQFQVRQDLAITNYREKEDYPTIIHMVRLIITSVSVISFIVNSPRFSSALISSKMVTYAVMIPFTHG